MDVFHVNLVYGLRSLDTHVVKATENNGKFVKNVIIGEPVSYTHLTLPTIYSV